MYANQAIEQAISRQQTLLHEARQRSLLREARVQIRPLLVQLVAQLRLQRQGLEASRA
jgi:hypothetical protein